MKEELKRKVRIMLPKLEKALDKKRRLRTWQIDWVSIWSTVWKLNERRRR